jgi:hypothetical protein
MSMIVYHVGSSSAFSQEQVAALMASDPQMLLIDTRKWPESWNKCWCSAQLSEQYGARYRKAGEVLGNRNFNKKHAPISIINLNRGIAGLMMYLNEGHPLILLCQCPDLYACHRYKILQALKEYVLGVEIHNADGTATEIVPEGVSLFGKG